MALKAGRVGVAPDQVDPYGKIDAGGYTLPVASANTLGGVKVGTGLSIADGVLSSDNPTPYALPTAAADTLGGVKVGTGLSIADGVLSSDNPTPYVLPIAAAAVLGGIKIGSGLSIDADGVVSAAGGGITPQYLGHGVSFNLPIPSIDANEFALWIGMVEVSNDHKPLTFVHYLKLSGSSCIGSTNTNITLTQWADHITAASDVSNVDYSWYRLI